MIKQLFKIIVLPIFCILFFNNCGVEPEEQPSFMNAIVGTYPSAHAGIKTSSQDFYGIEENNSTNIILKSDYTYSLYFKCYSQPMDSTIVISHNGTFEVGQYNYVDNSDKFLESSYFGGRVTFNSESGEEWGGMIKYYVQTKILKFVDFPILASEDGVEIIFYSWRK